MGIANRTDFDLKQHAKFSGKSLTYFDEERKEHVVPYVIEPSAGVDRALLAFLADAYREEEVRGEKRVVLRFHPELAPVKVAVLPLLKKREEIVRTAHAIRDELARAAGRVVYDDTAAIGRLYRRQDEVGTPYCVTVDVQTVGDTEQGRGRRRQGDDPGPRLDGADPGADAPRSRAVFGELLGGDRRWAEAAAARRSCAPQALCGWGCVGRRRDGRRCRHGRRAGAACAARGADRRGAPARWRRRRDGAAARPRRRRDRAGRRSSRRAAGRPSARCPRTNAIVTGPHAPAGRVQVHRHQHHPLGNREVLRRLCPRAPPA